MLKKLSSKLAAAAAAVVLAAGASGAGARAQTVVNAVIDVGPGERRCLDHPTKAFRNAWVNDYVMNGSPVKFVFLVGGDGGFNTVSSSGSNPVTRFFDYREARPSFPPSFIPDIFPGFFRTCARNDSDQTTTVYLSLAVDQ